METSKTWLFAFSLNKIKKKKKKKKKKESMDF